MSRAAASPAGRVPQTALVLITVLALAVGIWARFSNVTHKIYYQDEAITSIRTAGFLLADVNAVFDGKPHTFADLQRLERPGPDRDVRATIASLALEDPQHPPLYYVAQALWMRAVGWEPAQMRVLPVLLSLVALPLGYWCALELFGSRTSALVFTALLAVSPFQVLYSYQTREYGLLTVAILAASWALLRALRLRDSPRAWLAYALAVALGLYTYLLFAYVVIAHALYVALLERSPTLRLRRFVIACGSGVALAGPWLAIVVARRQTISGDLDWAQTAYPLMFMASKWAFFASATFCDLAYANVRFAPVALAVVTFALYALIRASRDATPRIALFIVATTATAAVLLVGQDLALHERFSTIARYLAPTWLGLQLAVAYVIGTALDEARSARTSRLWTAACALIVLAGAGADAINSRAPSWWENSGNRPLPAMAVVLAAKPHAIVVVQNEYAPMLSLAFLVEGTLRLQGTLGGRTPRVDVAAGDPVYLFTPSDALRAHLAMLQHLRFRSVYDSHDSKLAVSQFRGAVASAKYGRGNAWGDGSLWKLQRP